MNRFPAPFVQQMYNLMGEDECQQLCQAMTEEPPVSIRLNRDKDGQIPEGYASQPVPWCSEGHYLAMRPSFTLDPLFHAGAYYVQEASSMFVEQACLRIQQLASGEGGSIRRVLDLCAAPGGKSTLWRSLLPEGTLLVANEPVRQRAMILAENIAKWGHPDTAVTNAWPADFAGLPGFFDVIAADVPCSGEGMFRKDAGAIGEWSPENVVQCAARQRTILHDVWPALREGGYLIYSTCTFNREEDEDNVAYICRELGAEIVDIPTEPAWGIRGDTTGRGLDVCHFFPHCARGEGFFLALLRKTSENEMRQRGTKGKKEHRNRPATGGKTVAAWLKDDGAFRLFNPDETHVNAVREELAEDFLRLTKTVKTLTAGLLLAEERGRKFVPTTELALSTALSPTAFPRAELTKDEAIAYLRREVVVLQPDVPRGYVIATYKGFPLGFLNNLGSRANNLYPAEWRIRMQA